jgi:putative PIG3 family NAD(P)H quinone oxidoreductase
MRAIVHTGSGGSEVLALREVPTPEPGPGQVRVRVHAAGLNRADVLQRRGAYPAPPGWPADIPGLEYAGEIDQLGSGGGGITRWKLGDRVMGLVGGGAHAEFVVVHQDEVLAAPAEMPVTDAAAIPEAFLTAWDALFVRGQLHEGGRVLIHAAGSGVGTAAIQLAHQAGATVIGTSRTASKLAPLQSLGLDLGIDTGEGKRPFEEQLDGPVHLILDVLGGPALAGNLAALAPRGRLILLGLLQGPIAAEANLALILRKRLTVIGTVMRTREHPERTLLVAEFRDRALPRFGPHLPIEEPLRSAGHPEQHPRTLRPVVHAVFPMAEIATAHREMEANRGVGKIVLRW